MNNLQKLTLFYDAACPLCRAEIQFLSARNQQELLAFIDINSERYQPLVVGVSCEQALAAMYGQYADGVLISGVEVFSAAYERANLRVLAWIFSRKTLRPMLNASYRFFAKNRHSIARMFGPFALWLVSFNTKR
jgi:predicted DCC family thiol-disulfide oxidoreductase YuxK